MWWLSAPLLGAVAPSAFHPWRKLATRDQRKAPSEVSVWLEWPFVLSYGGSKVITFRVVSLQFLTSAYIRTHPAGAYHVEKSRSQ